MGQHRNIAAVGACFSFLSIFAITGTVFARISPHPLLATPQPTLQSGHIASFAEIQTAKAAWIKSAHADTYDRGMGANSTCARCKSPLNWNPNTAAAQEALNCAACKRVPGAPRPELGGGEVIPPGNWRNIGCEVCHQPAGDSYYTAAAFWNNSTRSYESIKEPNELCAKCHEGQHGFEVIHEQSVSPVHKDWACTKCHGAHGDSAACTDCHNPAVGRGAKEHARHPRVNCTACHDAGDLSIAFESDPLTRHASRHKDTFTPIRFAHTLTSWPSHNLQTAVDCRRCHHPQLEIRPPVAIQVGCDNGSCHPGGAAMNWCPIFKRDPPPPVMR